MMLFGRRARRPRRETTMVAATGPKYLVSNHTES